MLATKAFKFEVKANDDKPGQFAGRASVYGVTDAYNDVVMPGAFTKSLAALGGNIVVLNQHNPADPIGRAQLTDSELALNAVGDLVLDLPSAKDAYTRLQNRLIDGISIGYEVLQDSYVGGVRQLKEIKLWEISLVTFPANSFARVTDVKNLARATGLAAELACELKAGRVLSAANRTKIQNAHGALTDATGILQELLDLTDPNIDDAKAKKLLLALKRARLRLKDAQQVADAAAMVDQMIDALDIAFDQLLLALGLPDAPDPDDAAAKSLKAFGADLRAAIAEFSARG